MKYNELYSSYSNGIKKKNTKTNEWGEIDSSFIYRELYNKNTSKKHKNKNKEKYGKI